MTGPEVTPLTNLQFHMGFAGLSRDSVVRIVHSANLSIVMLQIIKDTKGQLPVSQLEMVCLN